MDITAQHHPERAPRDHPHLKMRGIRCRQRVVSGRPLLGARGVDAADLDRFTVVVRMGGSLGDVVKTLVRLSP